MSPTPLGLKAHVRASLPIRFLNLRSYLSLDVQEYLQPEDLWQAIAKVSTDYHRSLLRHFFCLEVPGEGYCVGNMVQYADQYGLSEEGVQNHLRIALHQLEQVLRQMSADAFPLAAD